MRTKQGNDNLLFGALFWEPLKTFRNRIQGGYQALSIKRVSLASQHNRFQGQKFKEYFWNCSNLQVSLSLPKLLILVLRMFTRKFNANYCGYDTIFRFPSESFMHLLHCCIVAKLYQTSSDNLVHNYQSYQQQRLT